MRFAAGLLLMAPPLLAHVLSMSSGDLTIRGLGATYEFRLPLYEVPQVADPAAAVFAHITFSSGGSAAQLLSSSCRADAAQGAYLCVGKYRFPAPVETLDVDCTFPAITVPNHVHLLRADNDGKRDQAVFDISFPRATLRFHPPTPLETAAREFGGGAVRAWGGAAQILFLAGLALAARNRRELAVLAAMFFLGQIAAATLLPLTAWRPPARFVEAAAGLTIAYLAVEILALPRAGMRWLIVGLLGIFHGLYFALFLETTGCHPSYVLLGALLAEALPIAVFALLLWFLNKHLAKLKPLEVCASALLVTGLAWFFLRLRN